MVTRSINRSALLLVISGILFVIAMVFHPDMTRPGFALEASWIPVHILLGISALLSILGLAGLYSPLRIRISVFGQFAFGIAILGNVLMAGMMFFFEAGVLPALSRYPEYSQLLASNGPLASGFLAFVSIVSLALAVIGWLMVAGYLYGMRMITPVNALLFIGSVLAFFSPPLPHVISVIGAILFGAGLIGLGISLKRGTAHAALSETLRLEDECLIQAGGHA